MDFRSVKKADNSWNFAAGTIINCRTYRKETRKALGDQLCYGFQGNETCDTTSHARAFPPTAHTLVAWNKCKLLSEEPSYLRGSVIYDSILPNIGRACHRYSLQVWVKSIHGSWIRNCLDGLRNWLIIGKGVTFFKSIENFVSAYNSLRVLLCGVFHLIAATALSTAVHAGLVKKSRVSSGTATGECSHWSFSI
jgi:hypothetical protein